MFGVTSRLIIALGLHRKGLRKYKVENSAHHVEEESRKRLFWCAYNLDKYLSAMLGRPSVFHDDEMDQVLLPNNRLNGMRYENLRLDEGVPVFDR